MQAKELKSYLIEDKDRIEKVLDYYDFHSVWYSGDEIRCAPPESDNRTAVSIRLTEDLYAANYSELKPYHGDLFGLLQEISDSSFRDVMKTLHNLFGLEMKGGKVTKKLDLLADIRKYKKGAKREVKENIKHEKKVLEKFVKMPHAAIIQECISPAICNMFDVSYDPDQGRIIFPHYDWIETDKIVGITGRTTMESEVAKQLDVPKYWNYIKGYRKTNNLYGFNLAKDNLAESKMLIIFEAEKSTLKQFTIERGKGFSSSVGGHEISQQQVDFILKNTEPDTEIVIAFDKDVMVSVAKDGTTGEQILKDTCAMFSTFRKTSYIFDSHNILGDKDSPIDCGFKIWQHLLKWRVKV